MVFERPEATQVVTFKPAPPQYAWAVLTAGTTNAQQTWAGSGQQGQTYAFAQLNTKSFTLNRGQNRPAMDVGDKFLLYTTAGGGSFPVLQPQYSSGATDIYNVTDLLANNGTYSSVNLKETTVFTVQGVTYNTTSQGTTSTVYFTPVPSSGVPQTTDGMVTLPQPTDPIWLGSIGHVSGLNYSYTYPGGCDTLSCLLAVPPDFRTSAMDPGRVIQGYRGGSCIWDGVLAEPAPAATGWTLTGNGNGSFGNNFTAIWNKWNADDPVNRAIGRGLRWQNPGIGSPAGIYLGPQQDSGSITVSDFLSLLCTGGALAWTLTPAGGSALPSPPWKLGISSIPMDSTGTITRAADLVLATTSPVPRTVGSMINSLTIRYQATADIAATKTKTAQTATYSTIVVDVPSSVQKFGRTEYYLDTSTGGFSSSTSTTSANPGLMTQSQAITVGQNILSKYIRANWSGSFTAGPGQLMNSGGIPVDPGLNHAGKVVKLAVTDAPYGGEVGMAPIEFIIGSYSYNEDNVTATIAPYQAVGTDMQSLFAALYPGLAGVA